MHGNVLGLKDLVNLEGWQKFQDAFSEVLGITLRTIDLNGKLLTEISGPRRLCSKILSKIPGYSEFCGLCPLSKEIKQKQKIDIKQEMNFKCPFDLDIFILPIEAFGNGIVAYMIMGPVILNKRRDKSEYAKYAKKIGIDAEELMDMLIEINVFSYNRIRSINRLISYAFSHKAQTGYHKKRLGEIAPELVEIDPIFSRYYEEKVLNAILNTCMTALDADSGSVMTLDKDTDKLRIRAASRLDQDIVDDTKVKVGEGIAGMVAATAKPLILPKDEKKNGLTRKMKRKYIKSSMIVPFSKTKGHNVYGVINLNVIRKGKEFSEKDIAFVKELINLASIALISVK